MLLSKEIKEKCLELGADAVGIAKPGKVSTDDNFRRRATAGFPSDLHYLGNNLDERLDPKRLFPGVQSIISIGVNYYPGKLDFEKTSGQFKVAKYAWGKDYHNILRKKLKKLRNYLQEIKSGLHGRICVDTAPFADVYWAQMAGLGWQGKQSLLISKKYGVRLTLGALLINCEVDEFDEPSPYHCGKCVACVDSCPTGAIQDPFFIDANKCISYHTIESKDDSIPKYITEKQSMYVFGCDICSDICPFNRFQKESPEPAFKKLDSTRLAEEGAMDDLTPEEFAEIFAGSPIKRPGLKGMKRNITSARLKE